MKYPLLPYSQLVFDMQKQMPDVYLSSLSLRFNKQEVSPIRLKQAIEAAIRNHPVFLMQVDEQGMQQYAPPTDVLHGQFHSVDFFERENTFDIYIKGNRILGDARSDTIIIEDVMRAYKGFPLLPDDYLGYLHHMEEIKHSMRYEANCQWLENEYGQLACPLHPDTDVSVESIKTPVEGTLMTDYSDLRSALDAMSENQLISYTAIISLASALAIMEYNDCNEAALTWAYDGRETPQEQRIHGSLHRDIPFKIIRKSKDELIRATRNQMRQGIAHSNYPFTLTKPWMKKWNYALNVLVQPPLQEKQMLVPFGFELLDEVPANPPIAYSLLDVEIYDAEQLTINYRYSASHYKPESIRKFAALVRKYVEWLIN